MPLIDDSQLKYLAFIHRENAFRHHRYDEEMRQYRLMRMGDPAAVEEGARIMSSGLTGHLADDPVVNARYLLIAATAIACRVSIEGGLDEETAYNASDLCIRRGHRAQTVEEILAIHRDMIGFYTRMMAQTKGERSFARPVLHAMEYIDLHLHEHVTAESLAEAVGLNRSYLSTLFRRETGMTLSGYILQRRMEAAENMLRLSDYTIAEISEILAFSSQSHFSQTFRKAKGVTPQAYRRLNRAGGFWGGDGPAGTPGEAEGERP